MVVGDAGVGKTRYASTFPKPFFIDTDKGTGSIRRVPGSWGKVTIKDAPFKGGREIPARGVYKYGQGWVMFLKTMEDITNRIVKGDWPYLTIVWDSLTTLQMLCMNHVLANANRHATQPQLQDYGGILTGMRTAAEMFTALPGFKILTAHVERSINPITTAVEKLPLGMGQFPALAAIFFDEIYYMEAKDRKNKKTDEVDTQRVLVTMQTSLIKSARTRRDVPDASEAHFKNVAPFLDLPAV